MNELDLEISDAIGQRNLAWHKERLGRFTSSQFVKLVSVGTQGTKARRTRLEKDLSSNEITQEVYDREMIDIKDIEYQARFGDGCRTYVYEKIGEILTQSVHVTGGSMATEWGTDNEAAAIEYYMNKTGKIVKPAGFLKYGDFAGGSPDGIIQEDNGIIEVKCPFNPSNHIKLMITENIPNNYFWQVHGNILASGAMYCDFISYDPRMIEEEHKMVIIRVDRDEDVQAELISRINEVNKFMHDLMVGQNII
jgi:hypothetical protein